MKIKIDKTVKDGRIQLLITHLVCEGARRNSLFLRFKPTSLLCFHIWDEVGGEGFLI